MRSLKALTVVAAVVLASAVALIAFFDAGTPKRDRYLIPDGYTGWLCVTYGVKGKPPLPMEDGYRIVRFDKSGIVETSTKGMSGKFKDEFLRYSVNGIHRLDAARELGGGGTIHEASAPPDLYTYRFWVSPNAERDTPPSGSTCGPWRPTTVSAQGPSTDCDALDMQAIRLAGAKKLDEAAALMDRALATCPTSASRMRSRGVLYAVMGDRRSAERMLNEAIKLSDARGDRCEAELTRAELTVINGGHRLEAPPKSCANPGSVSV